MELSILLIQQICQLFIMIFFGFLLVRGRVLTAENSKVLSILLLYVCLLYTSPSPRDGLLSRMPSSA